MPSNQLTSTLEEIGLTENEAKVYYAALNLGPTTILKIAKSAELKRTTCYSVIESLKRKGLMNIQIEGFKKKFLAEDPQKLEVMVEAKRKKLHMLLPEFSALYNLEGGEGVIKYYEGLEAIKGVYEGLIRDVKPGDDYLVLSNLDQWINHDREHFMDFLYRRAKLPIKIRMLFMDTPLAHEWKNMEKNFNSKVGILPPGRHLTTNLVITPQRVFIHQVTPPLIGIAIENKSAIRMHKEMYEIIWDSVNRE